MEFFLDYLIAFTSAGLQSRPVKYRDVTTAVTNQTSALQIPGGFRDAFAAYAEHAGNQFLGHGQFIARAIDQGLTTASDTVAALSNDADCRPQFGISV